MPHRNHEPVSGRLEANALVRERALRGTDALPLGGQSCEVVVDAGEEPEVTGNGPLVAKPCCQCCLPGGRCSVEHYNSRTARHGGILPGRDEECSSSGPDA